MRWKQPKHSARRTAVALALAASAATVAASGCFTHQCDASTAYFNGGHMVDANTYETNTVDEDWINYPGNVTLTVDFSAAAGVPRRILNIDSNIGVTRMPNDANLTNGAGAPVEYNNLGPTSFNAINATCAGYYARFVVYFEPLGEVEAGAD